MKKSKIQLNILEKVNMYSMIKHYKINKDSILLLDRELKIL